MSGTVSKNLRNMASLDICTKILQVILQFKGLLGNVWEPDFLKHILEHF